MKLASPLIIASVCLNLVKYVRGVPGEYILTENCRAAGAVGRVVNYNNIVVRVR